MWNFPRFSTRVSETTRKPDSVLETLVHNRRPSNHYTHCIHNPQNSQRYRILWWTRASFPLYLCFALGLPRLESRGVTVSGNGSKRLFKKHVSRVIAHSTHWLQNRAFLLLSRLPRRTKKKKKRKWTNKNRSIFSNWTNTLVFSESEAHFPWEALPESCSAVSTNLWPYLDTYLDFAYAIGYFKCSCQTIIILEFSPPSPGCTLTLLRNLAAFYVDLLLLGVHSLNSDEREAISESQNGKQSSTLSKRLQ